MERLKLTSKKAQRYLRAYDKSDAIVLEDIYTRPSPAKREAFRNCMRKFQREDGEDLRIIAHNTMFFSVAFKSPAGLRVITKSYDYIIEL